MSYPVTIKDIAKFCNVGVSTVSRALNKHSDVNPNTRNKITAAAIELGYIPNNNARNLRKTANKSIMVIVKGIRNSFFNRFIHVLVEEIDKKGYSLLLEVTDETKNDLQFAITTANEKKPAGIIFLGGNIFHSEKEIKSFQFPFVLCSGQMPSDIDKSLYSAVSLDDREESRKITNYLIQMGHKKIALLAADINDIGVGKLRLEGYLDALTQAGIKTPIINYTPNEETIPTFSMENGYIRMKELLEKKHDFTAVYALSDTIAIGACRALFDHGLCVPVDVSVIGFDGRDICNYYSPRLATLIQPADDMARNSAEILFEQIEQQSSHKIITLNGILEYGESVRPLYNKISKATSQTQKLNKNPKNKLK
ncbi:LacI family transcriptional regulator [Clostridiales bacterium COT073_COT-073]|nr:LacI family transcriptional regulator [Clostridiales bacterium COT073_COT-073]